MLHLNFFWDVSPTITVWDADYCCNIGYSIKMFMGWINTISITCCCLCGHPQIYYSHEYSIKVGNYRKWFANYVREFSASSLILFLSLIIPFLVLTSSACYGCILFKFFFTCFFNFRFLFPNVTCLLPSNDFLKIYQWVLCYT